MVSLKVQKQGIERARHMKVKEQFKMEMAKNPCLVDRSLVHAICLMAKGSPFPFTGCGLAAAEQR